MAYIQGHICTLPGNSLAFEPIIQPVDHRVFPQKQSFRKGHSSFRWQQTSLQLPITA
jgi:hypothetical protein